MAINFLTTTNTLPEIQINDTGNNPRLELQESGIVSGGISTTGGALVFEASSGIERARITSTGLFGIGTTTPVYLLDVAGDIGTTRYIRHNGDTNTYFGFPGDDAIQFNTSGSMRVKIDSAGIVTINDTGEQGWSSNKLNIGDTGDTASGINILTSTTGNAYILFSDVVDNSATEYANQIRFSHTDNFLSTNIGGVERMRIHGSGNVAIGTTIDINKLDVAGNINIQGGNSSYLTFNNGDANIVINYNGGGRDLSFKTYDGSTNAERMRITKDGNIAIGTTSTSYKLDVNGSTARIGSSSQQTTTLYLTATDTSGSPATATEVIMQGYEGRAIGTFYQDVTYSGEEWYAGMPYNGGFNYYQIGYDYSGSQAEYAANSLFRVYHNGKTILSTYGSGTHTGTAAKYLAVTSSGEIIETGSGGVLPGGPYLPLAGGTMTGTTRHGDDVVSYWGAGDDLEIYHNSSGDSVIQNHVGDLYFTNKADDKDIIFRTDNGSGGFTEYFKLDGTNVRTLVSKPINLIDGIPLQFGNSQDLRIYHNGNNSYIQDAGTGSLKILAQDFDLLNAAETALMIRAIDGAQAELYYGGTKKLETTSAGIDVSGQVWINDYLVHNGDGNTYLGYNGADAFELVVGGTQKITADSNAAYLRYQGGTKLETTDIGVEITGRTTITGTNTFFIESNNTAATFNLNSGTRGFQFINNNATLLSLASDGHATFASGITATNTSFSGTMNIAGGIYHIGDTNTYFGFDEGNDKFRVVTGGGERLGINNSGVRIGGGARVTTILDEDTMSSDSATALATQQSIKAYVDSSITGSTTYRGTWDPNVSLNSGYGNPNLNTVTKQDGYYYICSGDGVATPNGTGTEPDSWHTGDWVVYNSDLGSSGEWQKIDNTSVISGTGTGQKVVKWDGSGTSETLANGPITFSTNDSTFAGGIKVNGPGSYNTIKSTNEYTLGLIDSNSVTQWWFKTYTNGGFALHENGVGDQFTIAAGGDATFAGDVSLTDSKYLYIGASNDLQLYHDGTDSYVSNTQNSGDLIIQNGANGKDLIFKCDDGSGGLATYFFLNGGDTNTNFQLDTLHPDNVKAKFGTSADLQIYHDGSHSYVQALNTGDLYVMSSNDDVIIQAADDVFIYTQGGENSIICRNNSGVELYYDNLKKLETDASGVTIGALTSGETAQLTVNNEGGVPSVARFKSRTNKAHIEISDNDTTGYISSENGLFSIGRNAGANAAHININASSDVGIGTSSPTYKLSVSGGIEAGGKVTYSKSAGSLTTTGYAVAGLTTAFNGASAGFEFKCYGGAGKYQRIVYSCYGDGTTWRPKKVIDEGTNDLDVSASADGTTITFTYKATSATQNYSPRILVEATGHSINSTYA